MPEKLLEYSLSYEKTNDYSAYPVIIVAAGSASRMQGIDKLSLELGGMPLLARTVAAFDSSDRISRIVVVTREDKIKEYSDYKEKFGFKKDYTVVLGGASREESVLNGIIALGSAEKVLIHDGARPLITSEVIARVADGLEISDSVTCGVRVVDTIKSVNEDSIVTKTLNRDFLYSIQTPQGVNVNKFKESAKMNSLSLFTDDTSVLEAVGVKTLIVLGDRKNIKVTTPSDIALAEAYIKEGEL